MRTRRQACGPWPATPTGRRGWRLVSSFSSQDVDPERVSSAGARLLCDYLAYADAGGTGTGGAAAGDGLTSFEDDVRRRLTAAWITVVPRYGVGGYRVDFAAVHPGAEGRMVLAIEADGASYRDSLSARDRDRLRKEHLERLGWTCHRIWSTNWFRDPEAELARVRAAFEDSVQRAGPAADPEPPQPARAQAGTAAEAEPPGHSLAVREPSHAERFRGDI